MRSHQSHSGSHYPQYLPRQNRSLDDDCLATTQEAINNLTGRGYFPAPHYQSPGIRGSLSALSSQNLAAANFNRGSSVLSGGCASGSTSNILSDARRAEQLFADCNNSVINGVMAYSAPAAHFADRSQHFSQPLSVSTSLGNMGRFPPAGSSNPGLASAQQPGNPGLSIFPGYGGQRQHETLNLPLPVLQREYETLRHEYDLILEKLNSTMNSIKTFWSPELKKERTLRKEECSKLTLLYEQLRIANQDSQKQAALIRQLQDELQCQFDIHRTIRDADLQSVPKDEYRAIRLERDRFYREISLLRDTNKELELQVETQRQTLVLRDDSLKKLLDLLQSKGIIPYNAAHDRLELEQYRGKTIELDNRCRHLEALVAQKDQDIRSLQDECLNASDKLSQLQQQYERLRLMPPGDQEENIQAVMDTKDSQLAHMQKQVMLLENELTRYRDEAGQRRRDFTDKSVTDQEYSELRLKVEKFELELNHKNSENVALQTRLLAAEEQSRDARKHLELLKEASATKDQQIGFLQTDIEALRAKLENKNETIDQKTQYGTQLQQEKAKLQMELSNMNEQIQVKENKLTAATRRVCILEQARSELKIEFFELEALDETLKEKEQQLELAKARAATAPSVVQQQHFQDQLDELLRERERMLSQFREQRDRIEKERMEEADIHRQEAADLKQALESLQKEIGDRQMLIESQNEKIGELTKEAQSLNVFTRGLADAFDADPNRRSEYDRLKEDLDQARSEVDRLLKMMHSHEAEKHSSSARVRELEEQLREAKGKVSTGKRSSQSSSSDRKKSQMDDMQQPRTEDSQQVKLLLGQKEQRIEELEEALRESVSITAERELAVAQLKQHNMQLEMKINHYKEQLDRFKRQCEELQEQMSVVKSTQADKDQIIRTMRLDRKKHLEEVLELKQEALLAAISEKDAHIALLEMNQNKSPDEVHTLRKHKAKLMQRLKDENEKRVKLLNEYRDNDLQTPLANDLKSSPVDQIIRAVRFVELQKKKLRVFIDHLIACILDINPELLSGLPRTQQSQGIDIRLLKKLTREQLLIELNQRELDCFHLQHYANMLLQRLAQVQPALARRAIRLLESFGPTHGGDRHSD